MLRHVVCLQFKPEATAADRQAIADALAALPARIPQLRDYRFGTDAAIAEGNFDFAVVADVDDAEGFAAYRDDPEHQRIIAELIRPILAGRASVQFWID
ncbi:MAG: Dabb family protein [Acidimicrobiia bacterium]